MLTALESIRSENEFNLFWIKIKQFAEKLKIKQFVEKHKIDEPHLPRRKNIPNHYMIGKGLVNTQRMWRKNVEGKITLLLIA